MLLPIRSNHPPTVVPVGTYAIMIANTVAYCAIARGWSLPNGLTKYYALSPDHADWERVLIGIFLYNNVFALALGLWFIYLFGSSLESWVRTPKFVLIYVVAGIAGGAAKIALSHVVPGAGSLLGGSAAVLGVVGAGIYVLPCAKYDVWYSLDLFRSRRSFWSSDMLDYSGDLSWPLWAIGGYFLIADCVVTLFFVSPVSYVACLAGLPVGLFMTVLLRQRREDEETSAATATYATTQDLGLLSPDELRVLYNANPASTTVLLNWVYASMRSRWGIEADCLEAFRRKLPAVLENEPPESVAGILTALNKGQTLIDSKYQIYVAGLLEKKQHNQLAIDTYEAVQRDPEALESDAEFALFRLGVIYEKGLYNTYGAAQYYQELVNRFPMGDFVGQARARLEALSRRRT